MRTVISKKRDGGNWCKEVFRILRQSTLPISTPDIAALIPLRCKWNTLRQVRSALSYMRKHGLVKKSITKRDVDRGKYVCRTKVAIWSLV